MKTFSKVILIITVLFIGLLAFPSTANAAPLTDDRTVLGESYTLENGRILDGDLNIIGGVVEIKEKATVNGNVFVLGGIVTINGTIKGNLTAFGGTVNLSETATLEGDLISPVSYINIDPNAVVLGERIESDFVPGTGIERFSNLKPQFFPPRTLVAIPILTQIGRFLATALVLVALGALLLLIMPKPAERMLAAIITQPWHLLGFGALTTVVMACVLLLSLTICLIPFVILVGMVYATAVLVGWLGLGYLLGKRIASGIFNTTWHPVLGAALGNLVLFLIAWGVSRIPCIGWFPVFMSLLFGLGMVIATLFGTFPYPRSASKDEEEQQIILFPTGKPEEAVFPTGEETKGTKSALTEALDENQSDSPEEGLSKTDAPPAMPVADVVAKPEVPIETLNLGTHINTVLIDADLTTVKAVLDKLESGDETLLLIGGFDENSLTTLKKALQASGYKIP